MHSILHLEAEAWVFKSKLRQKQVVTDPLLNARQQVRVSQVLRVSHCRRMPRVIVSLATRTLTAQWPLVPSIGKHLQHFTGNGDVS